MFCGVTPRLAIKSKSVFDRRGLSIITYFILSLLISSMYVCHSSAPITAKLF